MPVNHITIRYTESGPNMRKVAHTRAPAHTRRSIQAAAQVHPTVLASWIGGSLCQSNCLASPIER